MPTEREKIESKLRMRERERVVAECQRQFDEFERHLQVLEAERNLPPFDRSKPLVERLARLGMREDVIDKIQQRLAAFTGFAKGDDPPESLKRSLAERADAEYSAFDQLAVLMESRRKR
jgi:hypothetical protein